jgi:uncharacterized protein YkwD
MTKTHVVGMVLVASLAVVVLTVGCDSIGDIVPPVGDEPTEGPTVTPYMPPATEEPPTEPPPSAEPPTAEPQPTATPEAPPTTSPPADVPDVAPPAEVADWPQEVLSLINGVRSQQGLPPFSYNATLVSAAQTHANDCSQRGSCGATGSDGSDLDTRLQRLGYQPAAADQSWGMSPTPAEAMEWWMGLSPPDDWPRRMILSDTYTEIGIGVAPAGYVSYFVLVFARP